MCYCPRVSGLPAKKWTSYPGVHNTNMGIIIGMSVIYTPRFIEELSVLQKFKEGVNMYVCVFPTLT